MPKRLTDSRRQFLIKRLMDDADDLQHQNSQIPAIPGSESRLLHHQNRQPFKRSRRQNFFSMPNRGHASASVSNFIHNDFHEGRSTFSSNPQIDQGSPHLSITMPTLVAPQSEPHRFSVRHTSIVRPPSYIPPNVPPFRVVNEPFSPNSSPMRRHVAVSPIYTPTTDQIVQQTSNITISTSPAEQMMGIEQQSIPLNLSVPTEIKSSVKTVPDYQFIASNYLVQPNLGAGGVQVYYVAPGPFIKFNQIPEYLNKINVDGILPLY